MAITTPFAQNGDKKEIPQTTSDGSLSFDRGFGSLYGLPPEEGGLFIDREQFNQLVYQITEAILANQQSLSNLSGNVYNKGEVDAKVNAKANQSTTYTKDEVNNLVNPKADKSTTYTKSEVDTKVNAKANANAVVNLSGNQTIAGVKTWSSPLVIPNGTANNHAVNKGQMDTGLKAKANANAVVNRTGNQDIDGNKNFRGQLSRQTDPGASDNSAQVATTRWINTFFNNKKAQIASWAMPDYSSTISGVRNNYRAPRDGYFVFSMIYGNGTKNITINGVVLANVITSSTDSYGNGYGSGGLFVPLAKNDVINIGSNAVLSYSYFIPCKGAN